MRSQLTPTEGRAIVLEVGDHGLSIRDPYGALLKAVPLEYTMLPELLRQHAGYETFAVGKWSIAAAPRTKTFRQR